MAKQRSILSGRKKLSKEIKGRGEQLALLIRTARIKFDWSQQDLANESSVGLDTIRSIESTRVFSPSAFIIADLASALKEDLNIWLKQTK